MADLDKMREQFEAAAKDQGLSLARTPQALRFANGSSRAAGDYVALETLCAWWAWQKSRADAVVDLTLLIHQDDDDSLAYYLAGDVELAIRSAGVGLKVTP